MKEAEDAGKIWKEFTIVPYPNIFNNNIDGNDKNEKTENKNTPV